MLQRLVKVAQAGVALAVEPMAVVAAVAVVPDETVAEMIDDVCSLYPVFVCAVGEIVGFGHGRTLVDATS